MKYVGSKNRHAKEILKHILYHRKPNQWYVEPFVGGFNIIDKVTGPRIANDDHPYIIPLFQAIQNGWEPPDHITEIEYQHIKNHPEKYDPALVGFAGFGCSYSGKWFGGYARGKQSNGKPRNYCLESKKNILQQRDKLHGIVLYNRNYDDFPIPEHSIIYCDPPYQNTVKYNKTNKFDHKKFWMWCREQINLGHQVYVSEYQAPDDFIEIWNKKVNNTLNQNTGEKTGIERLFVHISTVKQEEKRLF